MNFFFFFKSEKKNLHVLNQLRFCFDMFEGRKKTISSSRHFSRTEFPHLRFLLERERITHLATTQHLPIFSSNGRPAAGTVANSATPTRSLLLPGWSLNAPRPSLLLSRCHLKHRGRKQQRPNTHKYLS